MTSLTREDDRTFRRPPYEAGKTGLAYFIFEKRLSFRLVEFNRFAQNLSDEEFRSSKWVKDRPDDYVPADAERAQYGVNGNLHIERRRHLGFISEAGTEKFAGPFYLDLHTRDGVSDRGRIWFYEKDEHNDQPGVYVSVYISEARMLWLWDQMRQRPNAEVWLDLRVQVFQDETDDRLAEPDQTQHFYIEQKNGGEITGVTFRVSEPKPSPRIFNEDDEPAAPTSMSAAAVPLPPSNEKLMKRLISGVGWIIGLLALLLIVTLAKGASNY